MVHLPSSRAAVVLTISVLLNGLAASADIKNFYHVEQREGRWWIVNPQGELSFAVGTDHCNYRVHWCEKLGYAPYHRNCVEKYGGDEQAWAKNATDRLKAWGFNTLGANNSPSTRHRGLAHMEFLAMGAEFATRDALCPRTTWTGFPNVFSPKWEQFCDERATALCTRHRNDPDLLGYFIDNELEWYGKGRKDFDLCDEVFERPPDHTARIAFADLMRDRHKTIESFNAAWGTRFGDFDDLRAHGGAIRPTGPQAGEDKRAFVRLVADRYFAVTCAAIRRHDPNHMILGTRFAGRAPDIWDIAGKYCDVVTVNCYRRVNLQRGIFTDNFPEELDRWARECGRPMMITEWSFPALDSGLPCRHGAGQRFDTQAERAAAYSLFQKFIFSCPYMVGSMFFMWVDEPELGISRTFPEDSNYGLVNVNDEPYELLTKTASRVNRLATAIHSGRIAEVSLEWRGEELWARNRGGAPAHYRLASKTNDSLTSVPLNLDTGAEKVIATARLQRPGGHLISYALEEAEGDVNQTDNQVSRLIYVPGLPWRENAIERIPIVVANKANRGTKPPFLSIPLLADSSHLTSGATRLREAEGDRDDDHQILTTSRGRNLLFRPGELGPCNARTYFLSQRVGEPPGTVPTTSPIRVKRDRERLVIENGLLRLLHSDNSNDLFDRVELDGCELGRVTLLVWQQMPDNDWVTPNRSRIVRLDTGPLAAVLEIESEYVAVERAASSSQRETQGNLARKRRSAYTTRHQIIIPRDVPWFEICALELRNTDSQRWYCNSHFVCTYSNIAGSASDDELGGPAVPNHATPAGFWHDPTAQVSFGTILPRDSAYLLSFWVDEGGHQHPDVHERIERELAPGESTVLLADPIVVFAAKGERGAKLWKPLFDQVQEMIPFEAKAFSPERK